MKRNEIFLKKIFCHKLNRNGAIHVDWAISMGLFLVYITVMFVLIKPGYFVENKPESLFNIIDNNFVKSITTNVKEIQLVVERCVGQGQAGQNSKITLKDDKRKYGFSELMDENRNIINNLQGVSVTENEIEINCENGNMPIENKKIFLATSYPKEHYDFSNSDNFPKYTFECGINSARNCEVSLGIITEFLGFNEAYLNQLKIVPYETIINDWGFPENNKLKISVKKINSNVDPILISDNSEAPENTNVFLREYNWIYIDNWNNRESIKVSTFVW